MLSVNIYGFVLILLSIMDAGVEQRYLSMIKFGAVLLRNLITFCLTFHEGLIVARANHTNWMQFRRPKLIQSELIPGLQNDGRKPKTSRGPPIFPVEDGRHNRCGQKDLSYHFDHGRE